MPTNNKEYMRIYNAENKEKIATSAKLRYQRRKEEAKACSFKSKLKRHGWTPEAVEDVKREQRNCCAICKKEFKDTPHSDHEHTVPSKPRGLLCGPCNRALGMLCDSPELCESAAAYLRKWGK